MLLLIGKEVQNDNYIWIGVYCGLPTSENLPTISLPLACSFEPLKILIHLLKSLLGQNFMPSLGMFAGLMMALGYQKIQQHFGYCPTVVATGGLSCGKTTSLVAVLSTIGSQRSGKIMFASRFYSCNHIIIMCVSLDSCIFEKHSIIHFQKML